MWSYFGSKTNLVDLYPRPKHDLIVEPFAGTARYSLKHFEKDVLLIDKYPVIVKIWKWLQQCSKQDILKLPRRLNEGEYLDKITFDCEEARLFMGFIVCGGSPRPKNKAPKRHTTNRPNHINYNLQRVADNLYKIKHWKFVEGDYTAAPMASATWFVDPPYQQGGESYVVSNKNINYKTLGDWCKNLPGQVIVCENNKAYWLPFSLIGEFRGAVNNSIECIWTNEPTAYDVRQIEIFDKAI